MRATRVFPLLLLMVAACSGDPSLNEAMNAAQDEADERALLDIVSRTQPLALDPMECSPDDELCTFVDTLQGSCFVAGSKGRFLREVAQTFVAPTSGVVTFVRLNVRVLERDPAGQFPAVRVAVRELRDGVIPPLDETTFGEGLVPLDTLPDDHTEVGVSIAYGDTPTHVVQGREYALVVTSQGGMIGVGCNGDDTYAGGQAASRQARRVSEGVYSDSPFVLDKRDIAFAADIAPEPTEPKAVVTPATLAFGELQKGDSRTLDVTVHNDGDLALALSQVGLTGDTRFALLGSSFVPTLRGHSSVTFSVRFDATGDVLGPASATLSMSTNAPATPSVTVPLNALMTDPAAGVTPPALDFGPVALADAANPPVAHVDVTNTGFGSFQITAVRLTDDTSPNFVLTTPSLPIEVAAADSARIKLSFVPQGLGERAGTLEIETTDRDVPLLTVPLAGRSGLPANLAPLPSTIDVGPVQEGLSDERTFVIRNWGDDPLTISRIGLESTGVPGFSLEPTSIGTLGSGEARTVTVRYSPPIGSVGPANATVNIESDDQDTPFATIAVSATATNPLPTISITDIAFGHLAFDSAPIDAPIIVKNEGVGPLTLHSVSLVDGNANFSILSMPTLPAVILDGQQITVVVRFDSNVPVGARSDRVRFITNDREIPELETRLSGLAGAAPTLAVSPSSLSFDEVQGGKSKSLDLTLTNAGQYPLDVTNLRLSSGSASAYSFSPSNLQPIQPGQSRTVTVTLAPTAGDTGQKSGQLQFTTNDPLRQSASVLLSGISTNPIPTLSAAPVFPVTSITGPGSSGMVTLSNTGVGTLNVSDIRLAAGSNPAFSIAVSPSVPRALTDNTVTVAITFAPTAPVGMRTATLEVLSDDHETPLKTLELSALAGAPIATLSASSLSHGAIPGGTSNTRSVVLTNTGNAPLRVENISLGTGTNGFFSITEGAVTSELLLPAGGTRTITVRFAPTSGSDASYSGSLLITTSDPDPVRRVATVALSGTATNPMLGSSGTDLGTAWPDETVSRVVTLRNAGSGTLTISAISVVNGGTKFSITSLPTLPVTLTAGQSTSVGMKFLPGTVGLQSATLRVVTDDVEQPTSNLPLTGTGRPCTATLPQANTTCYRDVPTFVSCHANWWNLDGNTANGCEYACTKTSDDDRPDDGMNDTDCDGFDGSITKAIFVSPQGNDSNPGTQASPKRSILAAYAAASGKHVYVAEGSYSESGQLQLIAGRSIYGGFSTTWARDLNKKPSISFSNSTAVLANNLGTTQTVLDRVKIVGANASGTGASAYGVRAYNSGGLQLRHCEIVAGNGTAGSAGSSPGGQAASGGAGARGGKGCEDSSFTCASCGRPQGGAGGTNASCTAANGGRGGNAAHYKSTGSAGSASPGGAAGGAGVPYNKGNWNPSLEYVGKDGAAGAAGSNGTAGAPAFSTTGYLPVSGGNGAPGSYGRGGGGGGGGGGGDSGCDSYGGGGGGGGAGGCGGQGADGGTSAGGSFAVYLHSSPITIVSCTLRPGSGGAGGAGGTGQTGGTGAIGGWGGDTGRPNAGNQYGGSGEQDDGSNGGRGGRGGNGGTGGHGGGGAGGPSIGVAYGAGTPTLTGVSYSLGTAGTGGNSSGNKGPAGLSENTRAF